MKLHTLVVYVLLSTCVVACDSRTNETTESIAASFVQALNAKNTDAMLALSAESIVIREQEWESTADGYGYTLATPVDRKVNFKTDLREALVDLSDRVEVETDTLEPIISMIDELAENELSGIVEIWEPLDGYLFVRGMGDVEHIILIGVGPQKKVQALYLN